MKKHKESEMYKHALKRLKNTKRKREIFKFETARFEAYGIYTLVSLLIFISSGIVYKSHILGIKEVCYNVCVEPMALVLLLSAWIIGFMLIKEYMDGD